MNVDTLTFPFIVVNDLQPDGTAAWHAEFTTLVGLGAHSGDGFGEYDGIPKIFQSMQEVLELAIEDCIETPREIPVRTDIFPEAGGELMGYCNFDIRAYIVDHVPSSDTFTDSVMFALSDGKPHRNCKYNLLDYPAVEIRNNWNRFIVREEVKNETSERSLDNQVGQTTTET